MCSQSNYFMLIFMHSPTCCSEEILGSDDDDDIEALC